MEAADLKAKIEAFWAWFSARAAELGEQRPSSEVIDELNYRVRDLGIPAWEIESSRASGTSTLVLSPAGHPQLRQLCERVVAAAPSIPEWSVSTSKPRKAWNRRFNWPGLAHEVDASDWRFQVLLYPDGLFELVFFGAVAPSLSRDQQRRLLIFVIESELGEDLCRRKICRIAMEDPAEDSADMVPIDRLYAVVTATQPSADPGAMH